METLIRTDVDITDIKYDIATNTLLIQRSHESRWTIDCKRVIRLTEDSDDVAPFFVCDYLERRDGPTDGGYGILKALKVYTVFVEHEGVLHLRKYDNMIKKIKIGRTKGAKSIEKVALLCNSDDADAFVEVFDEAGIHLEIAKPVDKLRLVSIVCRVQFPK